MTGTRAPATVPETGWIRTALRLSVTLLTQSLPMTVSSSVNTVFGRSRLNVQSLKKKTVQSWNFEQVCTQSLISALHNTIRQKALAQSTSEKAKAISFLHHAHAYNWSIFPS